MINSFTRLAAVLVLATVPVIAAAAADEERIRALEAQLAQQQQMLEYDFRLLKEEKEKQRKRIEAEGIRMFQDIVAEGISDRYLKWKGIDATLALAESNNAKIVIIGAGEDGLPIILGPLESSPTTESPEPTVPPVIEPP